MKLISALLLFAQLSFAENHDPIVTVYGDRNNSDDEGNIKHPLLRQNSDIQVVNYPDVGAISIKLTQQSTSSPTTNLAKQFALADTSGLLTNWSNSFYTGNLYVGPNLQKFVFVFDTGS